MHAAARPLAPAPDAPAPRTKRARPRKLKPFRSPLDLASELTTYGRLARKERIFAAECSWRWATDIWEGKTPHSGLAKVRCVGHASRPGCGRLVPPQDVVVDPSAKVWPPTPATQGPPPPPAMLCHDCSMAVWDRAEREDHTVERCVRLELVGSARRGEYASIEFADVFDGSATSAALHLMRNHNIAGPTPDRLPSGGLVALSDDPAAEQARAGVGQAKLVEAIAAYDAVLATDGETVAIRKFEDLSGETAAAQVQRHRYRVARGLVI